MWGHTLSWFWFAFLWRLAMLRIFSCTYWPFGYLFEKKLFLCPYFNCVSCVLLLSYMSFVFLVFLHILDSNSLFDVCFTPLHDTMLYVKYTSIKNLEYNLHKITTIRHTVELVLSTVISTRIWPISTIVYFYYFLF